MSRLSDEIKKYQEDFKQRVPSEFQEAMKNATKDLENESLSKNALNVGDLAKSFALLNATNKTVSLNIELEKHDFLVLNFYRGAWCPYCNLELKALQSINNELKELNAKLIGISPQTPDASLSTQEKNELEFEVLSDEHNLIAKEYGLVFSLADELKPIYEKFGIDIPGTNKDDTYELPMPATYIINKKGEIIYAFIDEDYTKRSEPQTILDIIRKNS